MSEKEDISWDLTGIFPSTEDPEINETMENLAKRADDFIIKYKGKISIQGFSAEDMLNLISEYEDFLADLFEVNQFANLSFAANMTIKENQVLNNKSRDFSTTIQKKLTFIDLEIGQLLCDKEDIISDPKLGDYKHYLEKLSRRHTYKLSEVEEQLALEKDRYGVQGWHELQSKWLNTRMFEVEVEGELKKLPYGKANGLLNHPDRATRRSANKSIYGLLGKDEEIFSAAIRNICGDWVTIAKRRKYPSQMEQSLSANDVDQETIDNLMKAIEDHVVLYQRYLRLKAKIMDLPKLSCEDVVAPLPDAPPTTYTWDKAQELVMKAYENFDESFLEVAKDMFEKNHIDASPRFGKRNGAFCSTWYKGKTSFILQTFTGTMSNIYTLAHELGHAVHGYKVTRNQTIVNARYPMVAAETASIFGELLLTRLLLSEAETKEEKKIILSRVLDGAGMALFQVSSRVWFEQSMYDAIEKGQFLDGKTISKLWMAGRDKVYGDAVEWFEEMDWEWTMKGHYYMPNFRFYNYPYVFGQLFTYALYQVYQKEGEAFIPKFNAMLDAGGSKSPKEMAEIVGLDITKPEFWSLGMKQYEYFVNELEKLEYSL